MKPRGNLGVGALAVTAVAFAVYAATAARTITWWDGSQYPLAAVTLGIAAPPGSLLLTLMGWLVSKIPLIHPVAFRLNLFAALLGATLAGLITWLGARLATPDERQPGWAEVGGGALAGLTFAFGVTPWTYATQFTPYVLSELWTALILIAALAWWWRPARSTGYARLFVLFLLLGLDVSVHRTNLLLLPAALFWVAIRRPASGSRAKEAGAAASGLVLGLAFHLLLIPMAARQPAYMSEDPSDLQAWWSYVSLEMKGGGFLFNIFPRTADFFRVQVADYVAFLSRHLGVLFFLPAALAVVGWVAMRRAHPRRALGLLGFFLCAGPGAILYFNLPHGYFRPIDRHYLPSLVILLPWMAVGAAVALRGAARTRGGLVFASGLALGLGLVPLLSWGANRAACDLSKNRFAETLGRDLLEPLPERAILLTNGDNDSFPAWYLQQAEGVRKDVLVLNLPLANTGYYTAQIRGLDPDLARLLERERERGVLAVWTVKDTTVATVVEPRAGLGLPPGVLPPDSVDFRLSGDLLGQDRVALDVFRLTRWRRPVFLACTVQHDNVPWLWPYARLDGLAFRIVPSTDSSAWDVEHCRTQLFDHVSYEGLADRGVPVDVSSSLLFRNYQAALLQLATAEARLGHAEHARAALDLIERRLPPDRWGPGKAEFAAMRADVESTIVRRAVP